MKLKNGMILSIEKAVKEDAKEIVDYLNIVGGESDNLLFGLNECRWTVEQEEKMIEEISSRKDTALLVGKINGEIACVCSINSPARQRIAHQSEVAVSVKKKFWNIGVGTCLMNAVVAFAKASEKIEIIHLGVKADNVSAISLYKKIGFQEIGRYKNFFKINGEYFDEVLMNLYL